MASADTLNKTLTRTLSSPVDLTTGLKNVKFDIRSTRTGSNIKIGLHDSGGVVTEITPDITLENSWQNITWDLSGVSDANKNAIDQIIITIVNSDAANVFYIDGLFGETTAIKNVGGVALSSIKKIAGEDIATVGKIAGYILSLIHI